MNRFLDWLTTYRVNEWSDILGLLIAVVGFSVTIYNVSRSRSLATQALQVAKEVREDVARIDTVAELSATVVGMEAIKNYARLQAFAQMPDRLADLKYRLANIRSASSLLTDDDKAVLQGAIAQFSALEAKIDRALEAGGAPSNWARDNSVLSNHIDKVHAVLTTLKAASGVQR